MILEDKFCLENLIFLNLKINSGFGECMHFLNFELNSLPVECFLTLYFFLLFLLRIKLLDVPVLFN